MVKSSVNPARRNLASTSLIHSLKRSGLNVDISRVKTEWTSWRIASRCSLGRECIWIIPGVEQDGCRTRAKVDDNAATDPEAASALEMALTAWPCSPVTLRPGPRDQRCTRAS